jgi:hypothetical protein
VGTKPLPTCEAKATIIIGELTEADVTCGKEVHGEEEAHVATQQTFTKTGKRPSKPARLLYVWH